MLNNKTQETGRSMVEMLGVLAVIGVLSITGITGYTTAMNKHKANEILDAASKRAVAVSTQIQRGNTNPTLAEFEDETIGGAKFNTAVDKVGSNQFKLTFATAPSDDVKAQIKNIAGDGTGTVLIDSDVTRFLYNNDLSAGVSNTNNRDTNDATKCATGYKGTDCDEVDIPPCIDGKKQCASTSSYQECINGQWSEATDCPTTKPSCLYKGECRSSTCAYNYGGTCMCSSDDDCAADKPFCVVGALSMCVDTMVGNVCNHLTGCGFDAPYCNASGKCQATKPNENGSYCSDAVHCGTDFPYCAWTGVDDIWKCTSTMLGKSCSVESDCSGDAPYCMKTSYTDPGTCQDKSGIEALYCGEGGQSIDNFCCGSVDCSSYKAYCDSSSGYCRVRS